jgi:sirohydrochlorin cobaltochelatase
MKNRTWIVMTVFLLTFCFGAMNLGQKTYAAEAATGKKAILVVSFGTTHADTRKLTIEAVENKIQAAFPEYEVRRAFTSRIVIKRIAENEGLTIDTEKQALTKLKEEGFSEVIVQPLHMVLGDEYDKVSRVVDQYNQKKSFAKLSLGRPILSFSGQEERPDDYLAAINALQTQLPKLERREAVVFMGHGGAHPANAAYAALQLRLQDANVKNVFVSTVDGEGYPTLDSVIAKLKASKIKTVTLMPLMVVAGDHANNDMAGEDKDSFTSRLVVEGFQVKVYMHGLGENAAIQDIYVQHVRDAIDNKYKERGKDRPAIPVIE